MANAPTGPLDPSPSSAQPSSPSGDPAADPVTERRALRAALLARRASLPQRQRLDARIEAELAALLDWLPVRCLGFYWPIQQEFDACGLVARWLAA
ncbi:5-formyltetrahydrofolate cyclo-ligase, partial [Cupriavidus sp. HPC(L)]